LYTKPLRWSVVAVFVLLTCTAAFFGRRVGEGRRAFVRLGCPTCHTAGGAPSLEHVGRKYDRQTFVDWVSNPETVYTRLGRKPLNPGYVPMPRLPASHHDVEAISWFLSVQR